MPAVALILFSLSHLQSKTYDLSWASAVGKRAEFRVEAVSKGGGKAIQATTTLSAEVASVLSGKVASLKLATTHGKVTTAVTTTDVDDVSDIKFGLSQKEADIRRLGLFASVPIFLFQPISKMPVRVGQSWARALGGRYRAEALEEISGIPAIRVRVVPDDKWGADQVQGAYWFAVANGTVLRARIKTKMTMEADEGDVVIEWTLNMDRIIPVKPQ